MRLRFVNADEKVIEFLKANDYPHHWNTVVLQNQCLVMRIEDGDITVGYIWVNWIDGADLVLDFHVCIAYGYRAKWLSPKILADLNKLVEFTGAKTISIRPPNDAARRILKRMGFTAHGPFSIKRIEQ